MGSAETEQQNRDDEWHRDHSPVTPGPAEELTLLLEELRVMLPGIEVLFAFLLTVPFAERFEDVTAAQQRAYILAFLSAAVSIVCLIAPSAIHRVQRHPNEEQTTRLLRTASNLALTGVGFLAVALAAVVYVVLDIVYGSPIGGLGGGALLGLAVWLWYGLPLLRYR